MVTNSPSDRRCHPVHNYSKQYDVCVYKYAVIISVIAIITGTEQLDKLKEEIKRHNEEQVWFVYVLLSIPAILQSLDGRAIYWNQETNKAAISKWNGQATKPIVKPEVLNSQLPGGYNN